MPIPPEPTNGIRVNQEGYFPKLAKVATLVSSSTSPVAWKLVNSAGTTVAQGNSTVKGVDHASGDNVHIIDFSSYKTEGTGYKLLRLRMQLLHHLKAYLLTIETDLYTK